MKTVPISSFSWLDAFATCILLYLYRIVAEQHIKLDAHCCSCATVSYTYGCMQFAAMSFIISIVVWYGFLPCQTLSSGHVDPIDAVELVDTLTL